MLNIPEEIKNLYRSDNISNRTQKKFKITFYDETIDTLYPYETLYPDESLFPAEHSVPWLVIENDRIESESLTITESLSESEDLEFGSCEAATLEIVVADVIEDVTGREFSLTVEIGGYEMALGIYTVESFIRQADRRKRKITAYDRMRWFNTDVSNWYNGLNFPMTLRSFRDSLCDYIGIQQEQRTLLFDSMRVSKTIEPSQLSGLDVLKAICQINGCFGHIDKTGQLVYVQLQQTGLYPSEDLFPHEELYPSEFGGDGRETENINVYKKITYEDYLVDGITGLNIRQEEGDVGASVGDGENPYSIEGNFLVYGKGAVELLNIAKTLLPVISGRIYRPATIECPAMPWLEVGDAVIAPTQDDVVETFVMSRIIKGCQAMADTIQSTGSKKREEIFGVNKQIIQLEGKAAILTRNVEEVSVRVTDLKNYTESEFKVTAESITAEVTRATEEEGKLAASIKINADAISLKVSQGEVTQNLNSELKITGNSIALTTGHFTINSKNVTIDSQGNATFSGKVTGGSININNVFKVDDGGNTSITGNHFTWSATNSSMKSDGTITCKNLVATNGQFSGNISGALITGSEIKSTQIGDENGLFFTDGENVWIGGFQAYETEYGQYIATAIDETNGIGNNSKYALWTGWDGREAAFYAQENGDITCHEVYITKSWWEGWSLTDEIRGLHEEVFGGSDRTIKKNIREISDKATHFILNSNPVEFEFIKDESPSIGFIAQEVQTLQEKLGSDFPLVTTDPRTKKLRIYYERYVPLIVKTIQHLQDEIVTLKGALKNNENINV